MKICPKCKTELKSGYRCPKCSTIYRTKKEYNQSLYLIFGFYILMVIVFFYLTQDIIFIFIWMLSPFIIWVFIYVFTEKIDSYKELEEKWLSDLY